MKAIIVDDEIAGITSLKKLLEIYCPSVKVIATAMSISEGIRAISNKEIDLLFLDIKMPGGTGFDLLSQLPHTNFSIIFTTAYHEFAIKAFRFSALDYLMKPIDEEELIAAVRKAEEKSDTIKLQTSNFNELEKNLNQSAPLSKLAITSSDSIVLVDVKDIAFIASEGNYSRISLSTSEKILSSKSLGVFEEMLQGKNFFRVHKSFLINLNHIKKINKQELTLLMTDSTLIEVAQRRKNDLWNVLGLKI